MIWCMRVYVWRLDWFRVMRRAGARWGERGEVRVKVRLRVKMKSAHDSCSGRRGWQVSGWRAYFGGQPHVVESCYFMLYILWYPVILLLGVSVAPSGFTMGARRGGWWLVIGSAPHPGWWWWWWWWFNSQQQKRKKEGKEIESKAGKGKGKPNPNQTKPNKTKQNKTLPPQLNKHPPLAYSLAHLLAHPLHERLLLDARRDRDRERVICFLFAFPGVVCLEPIAGGLVNVRSIAPKPPAAFGWVNEERESVRERESLITTKQSRICLSIYLSIDEGNEGGVSKYCCSLPLRPHPRKKDASIFIKHTLFFSLSLMCSRGCSLFLSVSVSVSLSPSLYIYTYIHTCHNAVTKLK